VPQDNAEAVGWYRKAAEQGFADAQNNLGGMLQRGLGVLKNATEAVYWYRKAAKQGDAVAQYNLGLMYDDGLGVPRNYEEAVKWYRMTAEQGDPDAQNNLGLMYLNGLGVTQSTILAYMWFSLAVEQFSVSETERKDATQRKKIVLENIHIAAEDMTSAELAEAERLAREWRTSHNTAP